ERGNTINEMISPGPFQGLMVILEKGGPCSLFRGLGPNLREVASSRPTFFAAHSNCKEKLNSVLGPDSTWYMILDVVARNSKTSLVDRH
uniref:Uncharacterized protein n=1 Tax=Rhinolophus ferrumequinum TaxID=59479 RepID=A0A671E5Y3_RHIFE